MKQNIYVAINGEEKGPFELNSLPWDKLNGETLIWYEGLGDWVKIKNDAFFYNALIEHKTAHNPSAPPPLRSSRSKPNKVIAVAIIAVILFAGGAYFVYLFFFADMGVTPGDISINEKDIAATPPPAESPPADALGMDISKLIGDYGRGGYKSITFTTPHVSLGTTGTLGASIFIGSMSCMSPGLEANLSEVAPNTFRGKLFQENVFERGKPGSYYGKIEAIFSGTKLRLKIDSDFETRRRLLGGPCVVPCETEACTDLSKM